MKHHPGKVRLSDFSEAQIEAARLPHAMLHQNPRVRLDFEAPLEAQEIRGSDFFSEEAP